MKLLKKGRRVVWFVILYPVFWFWASLASGQTLVVFSEDLQRAWFAPNPLTRALPVDQVIMLGPGGPTVPLPRPIPPMTGLGELSASWQTKVAPYPELDRDRSALSAVFRLLSDVRLRERITEVKQLQELLNRMRVAALGENLGKWTTWGRDISEYLVLNVSSLEDHFVAFLVVANGLDDGTALSPQLRQLLRLFLELLLNLLFPVDRVAFCSTPELLVGAEVVWPSHCVDVGVGRSFDSIPEPIAKEAFRLATEMWNDACGIRFKVVSVRRNAQVWCIDTPLPGPTLAWSEFPDPRCRQIDQAYDSLIRWDIGFLAKVAAHELGHALGLGHSRIRADLMYSSINSSASFSRYPSPNDLVRAVSLYGPSLEKKPFLWAWWS